ncbi:hypothetical protein D7S86_21425 [Pararobbsia silviterrae]|uniref:Uncharacterized protein n=2 Tax=Pararobbsia silviterrae TaxID=1792498 RepID=A0A494XLZ7_9BURK|nr:hypothetical protein D7S86_21425 [Pararobbsia silviterrae]
MHASAQGPQARPAEAHAAGSDAEFKQPSSTETLAELFKQRLSRPVRDTPANRGALSQSMSYRDIPALRADVKLMLLKDDVLFPRDLAGLRKTELRLNAAGTETRPSHRPLREIVFVKAPPESASTSGTRSVQILTQAGNANILGFAASANGTDRYLVARTSSDCAGLTIRFGHEAPH